MAENAPTSPSAAEESVTTPAPAGRKAATGEKTNEVASGSAPAGDATAETKDKDAGANDKTADEPNGDKDAKRNDTKSDPPKALATPGKTPGGNKKKGGAIAKKKSTTNLKKTPGKKGPLEKDFPPGHYVMAKMKSYPPWPAIVLSEELLPEVLKRGPTPGRSKTLTEQPPSAWKTQFPILFMGTYEYAWTSSADIDTLTDEQIKAGPSRKAKGLIEAFKEVKEGFNLDNVKSFQENTMEIEPPADDEEEEEDEEMDDAEEEEEEVPSEEEKPKKKSARGKKRKKSDSISDDEADAEEKPPKKPATKARTPKAKPPAKSAAKPPAKTPKEPANGTKATPKPKAAPKEKKAPAPSTKKKTTPAPKKKTPARKSKEVVSESEDEESVAAASDKSVLVNPANIPEDKHEELMMHRRHKLQKCFLNKENNPPAEAEIPKMALYIDSLEQWPGITVKIIKATKIHKVVKSIYKLKNSIPRDDEYKLRERCQALWVKWNALVTEADKAEGGGKENGVKDAKGSKKTSSAVPEINGESKESKATEKSETVVKEVKVTTIEEDKPDGTTEVTVSEKVVEEPKAVEAN